MRASIIAVGSELLRGTLLDTNSQFFAQELQALGAQVFQISQVPDDEEQITSALDLSADSSDVIIIAGGLGPTDDDLTREAIIALTGEAPSLDDQIVEEIRARFTHRGDAMPQRNEKQAWKIPSSEIIPNPHGTAPGWFVQAGSTLIVSLPGPPRENRPMWRDFVRIRIINDLARQAIVSRTIKTIGIGESAVAERLAELIEAPSPVVATYAKSDGVHVTITAQALDHASADHAVRTTVAAVTQALGEHVYALDDESLAAAIVQPLAATGIRIALWEAGTGGGLSSLLLSDDESQHLVYEARLWPSPTHEHPGIRDFARSAAQSTGLGTAVAIIARFDASDAAITDGVVEVALAHAGNIVNRTSKVRGTPTEIRRRSALLAAEFLWSEIRSAAGLPTLSGMPSRSSRV